MRTANQPSEVTQRLYGKAQNAFLDWCRFRSIRQPASMDNVARYLEHVYRENGPNTTIQRMSAIGRLYRDNGFIFDSRALPIQKVLAKARRLRRIRRSSRADKEALKRTAG